MCKVKFTHYQVCFTFALLAFLIAISLSAQQFDLFARESFGADKDVMPYRILYPYHLDPAKKYPLILVLHGAGERGNDNELQLTHGAKLFLKDDVRKKFPAIVFFPQCPAESYWSNVDRENISDDKRNFIFREDGEPTKAMNLLLALLDDLLKKPYIDKNRMYVGGLSMGGMGTFELLSRRPHLFAAAFPICGGGHPNTVKEYAKEVSLWVFHGAKDDVVSIHHSEVMVDSLKKAGANVRFTVYPEVQHDSWEQAFVEPELLPWLFSHSRK